MMNLALSLLFYVLDSRNTSHGFIYRTYKWNGEISVTVKLWM